MVDVPCLDHLWYGQKDCLDIGQVRWKGDTKESDRTPAKKEPCLTPTLMDEGQARNPDTTYNGYIMEFWKFP